MFIKLTQIVYREQEEERTESFYINTKHIESIHPDKLGARVFCTGDEVPYETCETAEDIIKIMCEG